MKTLPLALLAASLIAAPAQARQYPPRDECIADASLAAFVTSLKGIVQRKDGKALLAVTASDIEFDLGEAATRAGFIKQWKLDKPATSDLWKELGNALAHGCSLEKGEGSAPYWYARGPDVNAGEDGLISGERVNVRAAASKTAKVLRTADWESVTIGAETDTGFTEVTLSDGTKGYVANDFIWTGYGYRALFQKRGGKWVITAFVAGD